MNKLLRNNQGFVASIVIAIVIVIGVLAGVGLIWYQSSEKSITTKTPNLENTSDLQSEAPNEVTTSSNEYDNTTDLELIKSVFSQFVEEGYSKETIDKFEIADGQYLIWVSDDNWTIVVTESTALTISYTDAYTSLMEEDSLSSRIISTMSEYLQSNGFSRSRQNTSSSYQDRTFYDYIEGYEQNDTRCLIIANPDYGSTQSPETNEMVPYDQKISLICSTGVYQKAYAEQIPFLKALDDRKAHISINISEDGKLATGSTMGRRTGASIYFYNRDGKWEYVWAGQAVPDCSEFDGKNIPDEYLPTCIDYANN